MAASASAESDGSAASEDAPGGRSPGAFRRWRRSRPFWGGLLLILAGLELFFLPLTEVLMRGTLGVVMRMGIGGISGVLIGGVLTVCGALLWFDPAHRMFYAIIGVLGGVLSFPATNFGGFFLGLLLGIIGGSMAFGWREVSPQGAGTNSGKPPCTGEPDEGSDGAPGAPDAADGASGKAVLREAREDTGASGETGTGRAARKANRRMRRSGGPMLLAMVVMTPVVAAPLLMAGRAEASQVTAVPSDSCHLLVICTPGSTPSPAPSGSPGGSGPPSPPDVIPPLLPSLPDLPTPGLPIPSVSPPSGSQPDTDDKPKMPPAKGTPGLRAYTAPVVLAAGSVRVAGFAYQGVAKLPTAGGGTVRMMKFTASSFRAFNGVRGDIGRGGRAAALTSPSLTFTGDIVIYATKFSGKLLGVPLTLTPDNAESRLMKALRTVTPAMPLTMTDVVANQPIMVTRTLQGGIAIAAS